MEHLISYLWSSLIFVLSVLPSLGDPPSALEVQQPAAISATIGEAVTLSCTYPDQRGGNVQATWHRETHGPLRPLDDMNHDYVGRLTMSSLEENSRGAARLTISELTKNDSDIYFCMVESFAGARGKGNGTWLEVIDRRLLERSGAGPEISHTLPMAAAPTISESRITAPNHHNTASLPNRRNALTFYVIRLSLTVLLVFGGLLGCLLSMYLPIKVKGDAIGGCSDGRGSRLQAIHLQKTTICVHG